MDKTKTRNKKKQNFINAYNEALREHYKLCRYKIKEIEWRDTETQEWKIAKIGNTSPTMNKTDIEYINLNLFIPLTGSTFN